MLKRTVRGLFVAIIVVASLLALQQPQPALAGGVVGNGTPASCTEAALDTALSGGGNISFNCGPNPHTIVLNSQKNILLTTSLDGENRITLEGSGSVRLFLVNAAALLDLNNITLRKGFSEQGGAVYNAGVLIVQNSLFSQNTGSGYGAAIYNAGLATISATTFSNNTAAASFAGAIYNTASGTLTVTESTFSSNFGGLTGGALYNLGTATLRKITFDGNRGGFAGAIMNQGSLLVEQSLFSGNTATSGWGGAIQNEAAGKLVIIRTTTFENNASTTNTGGAIVNYSELTVESSLFNGNTASTNGGAIYNYSNGTLQVTNSTFAENTANLGGGIYSLGPAKITNSTFSKNDPGGLVNAGTATVEALNTLLANNFIYNCLGTITSAGHNLEDWDSCGLAASGDLSDTNPLLGPLADNGGATLTYALLVGSPAINAGTNTGCPAIDQRGMSRPLLRTCDIGAYEFVRQQFLPNVVRK